MKKLTFVLAIILLVSALSACGNTDTTTTTTTTTSTVTQPNGEKLICQKVFSTQYNSDGSTTKTTHEYIYNEKDELVKQTDYDENGNVVNKYEYEYDENGTLIYETAYIDGAKSHEYEYDHQGNMTSETTYNPDGSVSASATHAYTYDNDYYSDGRPSVETCYIDSLEGYYYSKHYDMRGNLVESFYRGENPVTTTYEYDANGNCISSYEHSSHVPIRRNTYDTNGNLISEIHYYQHNAMEHYEDVYEYDEYNNCTKVMRKYPDGTTAFVSVTEYTYNEKGDIKTKIGYNEDGSVLYELTYSDRFVIEQ